jgi:Tfp pilus assembly protein PilN
MSNQSDDLFLGVMVVGNTLHAVLLRSTARDTSVLRRFTRQWGTHFAETTPDEAGPGFQDDGGEEDDFTNIQFGDEGGMGGNDMFLGSEFEDASSGGDLGTPQMSTESGPSSFVLELDDILAECRDNGYENPTLAFCASNEYVEQTELTLPSEDLKSSEGSSRRRKQLYQHLTEEHAVGVERERVAFLPMTPGAGEQARYLALHPGVEDPITPTLRTMREENSRNLSPIRFMDTETSLYVGLARLAFRGSPFEDEERDEQTAAEGNTLIVGAGAEDTLVTFLEDGTPHHTEMLQSLSAFDSAETICSRVLLLQDEYGTGPIQQVLLLSDEDELGLVDSFEMFFPDARVEALQTTLPALVQPREDDDAEDALGGPVGAAAGAAVRAADDERHAHLFEDVNLLPSEVMKRRFRMPISWQNVAVLAMLFLTVMFFMWRFFDQRNQMDDARRELRRYRQANAEQVSPQVLQARIDSLESTAEGLHKSLDVLDDLLVGSSQWSRAMEKTAREVAAVEGIWVESWTPQGSELTLAGNAVGRDRVVGLAERTNGSIEKLTFSEIRDWPVYSFTLNVPLEQKLPRAARYLRQRMAARRDTSSSGGASPTKQRSVPAAPASLDGSDGG